MRNHPAVFFFIATGAFACWLAKGFKGTFDGQMVSMDEQFSNKGTLRLALGIVIWFAVFALAFLIMNEPAETKVLKYKINPGGDVILEPVK